jgi:hypothetical protein
METKPTHEQAQLHLQVFEDAAKPGFGKPETGSSRITSQTTGTKRCESPHRGQKAAPTS